MHSNNKNWLTPRIIEDLPNIAALELDVKYTDGKFSNLTYAGFCIVQYSDSQKLKYYKGKEEKFLKSEDEQKIIDWFEQKNAYYIELFHRLDFTEYIYIFKEYDFFKGRILMGNILRKEMEVRLDLAKLHQDYLLRLLLNGRTISR